MIPLSILIVLCGRRQQIFVLMETKRTKKYTRRGIWWSRGIPSATQWSLNTYNRLSGRNMEGYQDCTMRNSQNDTKRNWNYFGFDAVRLDCDLDNGSLPLLAYVCYFRRRYLILRRPTKFFEVTRRMLLGVNLCSAINCLKDKLWAALGIAINPW